MLRPVFLNLLHNLVRVNQLCNFHTVPAGVSTLSRVTVQRGGSVTIPCFYGDRYKTHVKYWCRGDYRDSCTPIVHSDSPQEGKVSIRDDPDQQVFTVTINDVTAGDSDYYWCGVEISRGSDVGDQVKLLVTHGKKFVLIPILPLQSSSPEQVESCLKLCWMKFWSRGPKPYAVHKKKATRKNNLSYISCYLKEH
uniref:Ig-like domain-containing protein n=1 Tax=Paramormyrops kingsleyae TaxID=1676925 RepID=A0A3B3Q3R0_9TELE